MDCPNCNSQDIEIGESEITGTDFTAKVWYASCHATIGEDVNWGGGYDCEFFIVRESKEALLAEAQRLTKRAVDGGQAAVKIGQVALPTATNA